MKRAGRVVKRWTSGVQVGAAPVQRVVQTITFDDLGERVASRSVPIGELTNLLGVAYDRYEYDGIGRIKKHTTPRGGVTTYQYKGRRILVTTPSSGTTVTENDALGRPVRITDPEDGVTRYQYGPFGSLWIVFPPGGGIVRTDRDAYGRVRTQVSTDRGTTTAHYDGFGQLRSTLDANQREAVFEYDALGRMTSRTDDNDLVTKWEWDTAPHGVGRIAEVMNPDGHTVSSTYDAFGRPEKTTLAIDGESFAVSVSRDPFGRVDTVTYAADDNGAPFVVQREYDPHGHLRAVKDPTGAISYWRLTAADTAGRIKGELFGNGATTTRGYNTHRNRLTSRVTNVGGTPVQDLSYTYDDQQNLSTRTDHLQQMTEYFEYDRLDRLKCADFDPAPTTWRDTAAIRTLQGVQPNTRWSGHSLTFSKGINTMKWIASSGGPLVMLPASEASRWRGASGSECDMSDYALACQIEGYAGIVQWLGMDLLVLNDEPLQTCAIESDREAILVRWMYAPNEAAIMRRIDELRDNWGIPCENVSMHLRESEYILLDAAAAGECGFEELGFMLRPGPCTVFTHVDRPSTDLGLLLHVFRMKG